MAKSMMIGNANGIAKKVIQPYIGNANGVAKKVKAGWIGDANGIAKQFYASQVVTGDLPVGTSVFMNIDGVRTEFYVIQQGIPSDLYDASCNGTWVTCKYGTTGSSQQFGATNEYSISNVHTYLNNTFIGKLDSSIQSIIKQVKIPYTNGTGKSGSIASGSNGLSTKIFVLSAYEVGYNIDRVDGTCLEFFKTDTVNRRLRYNASNNSAIYWWLRSPMTYSPDSYNDYTVYGNHTITDQGAGSYFTIGTYAWAIPSFILPSDTNIDENFNIVV